ncbi:putative pre-rRNA processing protein [Aspergillus clavatus NRRL 1]|uniref:rRNA biogenesis protein rrp36 n=1 Tax=Aspergillus clavatus (strain ATCC 1007 / CBS 513.65 / DSM 816 / NCTC 3887 / NRRL 1 / QM 1276 / 107) TaxID=344612 RepID=RRP36_ASPCL|nr:pre-rRNA processing protein, putative [Aspergillus clavatus NRRL 1]A1CMA3.1 RecName: Full=rRNA biogenesis protein rrp36; AltName: Full=Ribosomal RNA-processing protein 36 [Aspergillus clavatus NRRL 1]EAW08690.1 pre-rRNA processing protein, putative [Aspergillus clavatus NRRL 1]
MAISDLLNRRVRALPEEDEEVYSGESASEAESNDEQIDESRSDDSSDESLEDHGGARSNGSELSDDDEADEDSNISEDSAADDDDESDASEADDMQASLSHISFGALAKAQASLGPHAKRKLKHSKASTAADAADDDDEKAAAAPSPLDDIRARIREAREQKRQGSAPSASKARDAEKPSRSSKHAPMVQSSKHAVSRKRTIIEPPAVLKSRDPRFDPAVRGQGGSRDGGINKAYAFLDEYRANELKELKEKFAKTKDLREKEDLKRAIRATTDRLRTTENRRREKEVLAEHKKREKQLILEGKKSNPYFLKKSELKKQVLVKKYESMGSRQRVKALERRQKKMTAKERKEMPMERRGFENDAAPFNNDGGGRKRRKLA